MHTPEPLTSLALYCEVLARDLLSTPHVSARLSSPHTLTPAAQPCTQV